MHPEIENNSAKFKKWLKKKGELLEEIEKYERELESVKAKLKGIPKHIIWAELEDADKFYRLLPGRKRLMDTVRMIAYQAETAMASMMICPTVDRAAARRLLQDLFVNDVDILPEPEKNILRIHIHNAARPAANHSLEQLLEQLKAAKIKYTGTQMALT